MDEPKQYQRDAMAESWATPAAMLVWATLHHAGPLTIKGIADAMGWTPRMVEPQLARLRVAGFVAFEPRRSWWSTARDPRETLRVYEGRKAAR